MKRRNTKKQNNKGVFQKAKDMAKNMFIIRDAKQNGSQIVNQSALVNNN